MSEELEKEWRESVTRGLHDMRASVDKLNETVNGIRLTSASWDALSEIQKELNTERDRRVATTQAVSNEIAEAKARISAVVSTLKWLGSGALLIISAVWAVYTFLHK